MKPRLLDACCGVGGATRGYQMAGWHVTGVDINPQPRYIGDAFVQADAITYIREHGHTYDAIHASPPCLASTALIKGTNKGREYPQLIPATREALQETGRPWVMENVVGAPLRRDLLLCGEMFSLGVLRHRVFELSPPDLVGPVEHPKHRGRVSGIRHGRWYRGPYVAVYGKGGGKGTVAQWQDAMDIHWPATRREIAQAIPPAYTHLIGRALLAHLGMDTEQEVSGPWH
ncbi:hypothetical protein Ppa06_58280 [Planomonospora parontospora subsp. parontospora]|uniref:DNA methylase n=2 Tax=Planomonospora parontospora TaxID=58119 RepID=A0AA37BLN4_9ACTN|nr:DNA cytosine methyltransferase [Planomonospora parontospora]GGK90168.1 hypothetical protein GCM10010126_57030 [Planomonospora parontospora]GII12030.1 hypothetical protein Ppa06_58280 [Planomonospora parontospora subsp. parontospora]